MHSTSEQKGKMVLRMHLLLLNFEKVELAKSMKACGGGMFDVGTRWRGEVTLGAERVHCKHSV